MKLSDILDVVVILICFVGIATSPNTIAGFILTFIFGSLIGASTYHLIPRKEHTNP
jgi:hypothetical protein